MNTSLCILCQSVAPKHRCDTLPPEVTFITLLPLATVRREHHVFSRSTSAGKEKPVSQTHKLHEIPGRKACLCVDALIKLRNVLAIKSL